MSIPLLSVRHEAVFRAAQERIKRYILDNGLQPGDALPTEPTLARDLGISRNSLREALKSLETVGVVETRHGSGTYVGRFSLTPLIAGMTLHLVFAVGRDVQTLREMLELRQIIEAELVMRVAGRHSTAELAALDALVAQMETLAATDERAPEADRAYHEALYAPLHNRVITQVLHAFWDVFQAVQGALRGTPPEPAAVAAQHRAILAAVRMGDGPRAAAAIREHFAVIARRIGDES